MFVRHALALAGAAALLAACGGKDTLFVSVSWPDSTADVLSPTVLRPTMTGFEGHEGECSQHAGTMAPGMRLNADCTIAGTPIATGTYNFEFDIRVDGVSGKVNQVSSITVIGPSLSYPAQAPSTRVSANIDAMAALGGEWSAPPASAAPRWSFSVIDGALAPGLALDAATGTISGTLTQAGSYSASVRGVLTTNSGIYAMAPRTYSLTVVP